MTVNVTQHWQPRGITYLPNGQRCETWVPMGAYLVEGDCLVSAGHSGQDTLLATKIHSAQHGTWYIGRAVAKARLAV